MENFFNDVKRVLVDDNMWVYLWDGLKTTIIVTFFALLIGLVLGLALALIRVARKDLKPSWRTLGGFILNLLNKVAGLFITFIRGTPTMVQLLMMFTVILVNIDNLRIVAIITFGINSSAYMSELFRGGIQGVDRGEQEAARSLGLSYGQTMRYIVFPQAFKNSLPALGNEVITLFKETSIAGTIGLIDLTRGAGIIISNKFTAFIPYFTIALIYLFFVLLLEKIFAYLERRAVNVKN